MPKGKSTGAPPKYSNSKKAQNRRAALIIEDEVSYRQDSTPNAKAFCGWLGLCPNKKIRGPRILSSRTKHVVNRVAAML